MKNYFIVNPVAGNAEGVKVVNEKIANLTENIKTDNEFNVIVTKTAYNATEIAKKICEENKNEVVNIFACGGDGTCFEVVNGIIGYENVNFGIIPVGSCNDFLKNFPEHDFLNIEKLISGKVLKCDAIEINNEVSFNVANFGFDARTNYDLIKYRSRFKTIKKAYNYSLFRNIISPKIGDKIKVFVDGKLFFDGKTLLSAIANGKYYGGGYKCAPFAILDDGQLEVVIVKKVSVLTFARLVKDYKRGNHLYNPKFSRYVKYIRGSHIEIIAQDELVACLDGETRIDKKFVLNALNKKINFILPE